LHKFAAVTPQKHLLFEFWMRRQFPCWMLLILCVLLAQHFLRKAEVIVVKILGVGGLLLEELK